MSNFEPMPDAPSIEPVNEKAMRLEHEYTDIEILQEARRRGLLMRVEAETIVPSYIAKDGYPIEDQIERTMADAAHEATRLFINSGKQPRGMKIEWVNDPNLGPSTETHRRLRIPLNFVVERQ